MKTTQAIGKVETLAAGIIRTEMEYRGYKRLNNTKENIQELYKYVFGLGENPHADLNAEKNDKLQKIQDQIDEVIQLASK